jgi:polyhydroxyalkanoate synthesis regulator phasin
MRRYLKAGMTFTDVTRARANELLRELIKSGESERLKAQDWVEDFVKTGRHRSGAFISTVRGELRKPFKGLGFTSVDDLATKGGEGSSHSPGARKTAGRSAKAAPATVAPAKRATARKVPTKTPARKVPAKRAKAT